MPKITLYFLIFIITQSVSGLQNKTKTDSIKRYYYKDKIISREIVFNAKKEIIHHKTYYKSGEINEDFYLKDNNFHGKCFKYNKDGKLTTTWKFKNGDLISREDHIIVFNAKNKEVLMQKYQRLKKINTSIKETSTPLDLYYRRANLRHQLNFNLLALQDSENIIAYLKNSKGIDKQEHNKYLGNTYDIIGSIYSYYEMDNYATHYKYKAVEQNPENNRLVYNLATTLYKNNSKELSVFYLKKVLEKWPTHGFSHLMLSKYYLSTRDYKKAKLYIDKAFLKEKNLIKFGNTNISEAIRILRGRIYYKLNDTEFGLKDLKYALKLNPKNVLAHKNIAIIYNDLQQYKTSCYHLKKAKKLGYKQIHDNNVVNNLIKSSCIDRKTQITEQNISKAKPYIFPNPVKEQLHIKNLDTDVYTYNIYNFESKLVKQGETQNNSVNFDVLPTGLYILQIKNKTQLLTFKVIKN